MMPQARKLMSETGWHFVLVRGHFEQVWHTLFKNHIPTTCKTSVTGTILLAIYLCHRRKAGEMKEETGLMVTSCTVGWDIKNPCCHFCSFSRLNSVIENSQTYHIDQINYSKLTYFQNYVKFINYCSQIFNYGSSWDHFRRRVAVLSSENVLTYMQLTCTDNKKHLWDESNLYFLQITICIFIQN